MAWFRNSYECPRCGCEWIGSWSCMCDDDCPECGKRHISPYDSDNVTEMIKRQGRRFVVFRSPEWAEDAPKYNEIGAFRTREEAEEFLETAED